MAFPAAAEQGNSLIELADRCIFLTRTTCLYNRPTGQNSKIGVMSGWSTNRESSDGMRV
jgi:hypothetical protein